MGDGPTWLWAVIAKGQSFG